jgi:hypothetical protein
LNQLGLELVKLAKCGFEAVAVGRLMVVRTAAVGATGAAAAVES